MDFKKRLSKKPVTFVKLKTETKKFRRIDGLVFPDELIIQGGKNPEDFPETTPPTTEDVARSVIRARKLEV